MKSGKLQQAKGAKSSGGKQCKQLVTQPKQLFAKLKQCSKLVLREHERSCSSEKEHKMNALAPRAEEGRDNLR